MRLRLCVSGGCSRHIADLQTSVLSETVLASGIKCHGKVWMGFTFALNQSNTGTGIVLTVHCQTRTQLRYSRRRPDICPRKDLGASYDIRLDREIIWKTWNSWTSQTLAKLLLSHEAKWVSFFVQVGLEPFFESLSLSHRCGWWLTLNHTQLDMTTPSGMLQIWIWLWAD